MAQATPLEFEQCLRGVRYPAMKQDLIKHAQQQGANQNVLEALRNLREGNFNSPADVNRAISQMNRQ